MVTVNNCPICGSDESVFITDKGDKFNGEVENICTNCGLGYLSPRMGTEEIEQYYLTDSFSGDFRGEKERGEKRLELLKTKAARRWEVAEPFMSGGNLLEIGCSSGEFLELASQRYEVYGIDPSSGYVKSANVDNLVVGMFPDYDFSDKVDLFDAICVFHTLEHVTDPLAMLQGIYDRLSDDGVFILEYPDLYLASQRALLLAKYFQKSHLHDFSNFNIVLLLARAGFRVNNACVPDTGYPSDKNTFIICAKSEYGPGELLPDPVRAKELIESIQGKLSTFNINLGRPLNIVHIGSQHINIGDGAISYGIREGLTQVTQQNIQFYSVDIVDYANYGKAFTAEGIEDLNPDLIVVGGGGTIDGHENRIYTGTAFTMPLAELEKLSTPIAFVGLGHNLFPAQEFHQADVLSDFIEYCRGESIPFSVRRDGSWTRLHDVIDSDLMSYVDIIPDPGFFIKASGRPSPHFSPIAEKKIVIQIASDAYMHRFGDKETFEAFLALIVEYAVWAIDKYKASISIAVHTLDDMWGVIALMNDVPNNVRRLHMRATGVYHPVFADSFFDTYQQADLVVGMRGHSAICGTALGVPTIALASHAKVSGYMREADASDWAPNVRDDNLLAKLQTATEQLMESPNVQLEKVAQATKNWPSDYYSFLQKVVGQLV